MKKSQFFKKTTTLPFSTSSGWASGQNWQVARLVATLFLSVIVCEVHPELFWGLGGLRTWVGDFTCEGPLASFGAIQLSDRLISAQPRGPFYHLWRALLYIYSPLTVWHLRPDWSMFLSDLQHFGKAPLFDTFKFLAAVGNVLLSDVSSK